MQRLSAALFTLCFCMSAGAEAPPKTEKHSQEPAAKEGGRSAAAPVDNIVTKLYLAPNAKDEKRSLYVVAEKPIKDGVLKISGKDCKLVPVKWAGDADSKGHPYFCESIKLKSSDKFDASLEVWDENKNRRFRMEIGNPNEDGILPIESFKSEAKQNIDLEKEYEEKLPPHIREFIRIYKAERPHMKYDKILNDFAQNRAVYCMTVKGGHAPDVNGQLRKMGYPLPAEIGDNGNQFESLWASDQNNPRGALDGWRSSSHHRTHVWGQSSPWNGHTKFGVGYYNRQWVFISAP